MDTSPVLPSEFAALMRPFAPFESHPVLALAVSGGRDSRALALLAWQWAARRGGRVVALVVDHGLRAEAAAEAAQTSRWLAARGIPAHVLCWRPAAKPQAGVQAAARQARYRLLLDWCRQHQVLHLLTAHQADDQAETYALRAARDSGPSGLAAMSALVEFPEARLLRPLLAVTRARLTATLQARGQDWIDDPSNMDPRFARGRLRREGLPLTPARALAAATRFAARRVTQEGRVAAALADCAMPHPLGVVMIDHAAWRALPASLARVVLASVIATVAGAAYPPRQDRTQRAVERMRAVPRQSLSPPSGLTVGGCRILWRGGGWLVVREPASIRLQPQGGRQDEPWDGRFTICGEDGRRITDAVRVAAPHVARTDWSDWEKAWPAIAGLPAIVAALPCRGAAGRPLPVPVPGGMIASHAGREAAWARFQPRQPLAAGPFFPCFAFGKGQIVNL
ncbi:tRNA lysidine(34) synthetase TilS [Vineibacter terrae]|uniref:tRNA(Ile)-lysidine synthase n=1 Tax=Vineibacter terrae TaxID=2586908 RepID=A0A5C8P986_9HYPH|nr:tRNA lysidine(34) synthetase TilS [Vineibacter terrae]TXL70382.1 tRNA lysidine(34) synthetase TilS [Vineibacter terrae]